MSADKDLTLQDSTASPEPASDGAKVARFAGIASIAILFSRFFGLIREIIFAKYFGAGFLYDAFIVGFRVPNLLRDLFAEGALSNAFVKIFTDYITNRSEAEAWRLASLVFNVLAVVMSIITIAGIFLSPLFVKIITYNYLGDPNHYYPAEKAALATVLMQIMFPFILLVAMAALAMGVLNTKGRFGIPASASTAFNITSIVVGLGLAYWLSGGGWERSIDKLTIPADTAQWAIIGMAIGTLVGGAAQLLIQIPSLYKVGFRFRLNFNLRDEGLHRVMRLMAPAIIGTGAIQIKVLVDTIVASGIDGGASWLSYAFRLMMFPIGVIGVSVGTAAIPTLSRLASEGNTIRFRNTLSDAVKLVILVAVPSACGLIVLSEPIISLLFQRGEFTPFDTDMTAWALTGYAIGLAGYASIKVLSPGFFALEDGKTPMLVSLASIVIHVPASFLLMQLLSTVGVTPERPNGYGHVGVALATTLVSIANFLALLFLMRRRIKRINGGEIMASLAKTAAASAVMAASAFGVYYAIKDIFPAKALLVQMFDAFVPIAAAVVVFVIAAKLLRISEMEKIFGVFQKKFGFGK